LLGEGDATLADPLVESIQALEIGVDQRLVDEFPRMLGRLPLGNCPAAAALLASGAFAKGVTLGLALRSGRDGWEDSRDRAPTALEQGREGADRRRDADAGGRGERGARRYGVAQSLLFTWRRLARMAEPVRRDGSILLPVEIDATAPRSGSAVARPSRPTTSGRRPRLGVIEIELGSGNRVRAVFRRTKQVMINER
jgi:transposase-like protein